MPIALAVGVALNGCGGKTPASAPQPAPAANDPFVDVTDTSGLKWVNVPRKRPLRLLESVGFGGGFIDVDQDGLQDVLLVSAPRCALFHNAGNGKFTDVTERSGLTAPGNWIGCAVCDYDNDGYPDVYLTGYERSALYHNERNGSFKDVTAAAGVAMLGKWSVAATFADFDRDGLPDLYVGTYCKFGPNSRQYCTLSENHIQTGCRPIDYEPEVGHCFRNLGGGKFQDVTKQWGLDQAHGKNLGAAAADYDNDGWPDLYLANDEMPGDLFHNDHGKGFTNVGVATGTAFSEGGNLMGGMGVDWGDYDNDGWLDLVVGTFESEDKPLYRNVGGKNFEFASPMAGILTASYPDVVFGSLLFDYDNDGRLDLLFVNGHVMDNIAQVRPTVQYRQPARLFHNRGQGAFDLAASPTLSVPIAGRAVACADYLNNGSLGLLVVDMDGKVRLLQNAVKPAAHWLELSLQGVKSNRDALGARVTLKLGSERRVAEVATSRSYISACDRRVHFGLGERSRVDELEIRWPSGLVTRRKDVAADQILSVVEGK